MVDQNNKRVVGLKYDPDAGPPSVILKGGGEQAEAILKRRNAMAKPIPLVRDEKLLDQLYRLPIDAEIGPELFEMVAIILVHIFTVDQREKITRMNHD